MHCGIALTSWLDKEEVLWLVQHLKISDYNGPRVERFRFTVAAHHSVHQSLEKSGFVSLEYSVDEDNERLARILMFPRD